MRTIGTIGGCFADGVHPRRARDPGIAVTGSVFYGHLRTSHGDFATAFRAGLVVIVAFVGAALILALADAVGQRRLARRAPGYQDESAEHRPG